MVTRSIYIYQRPDRSLLLLPLVIDHRPGDSTFTSETIAVVNAAQATIIRIIAGVAAPEARPTLRKKIPGHFPDGHDNNNAFDGWHDPTASGRSALEEGSQDMGSSGGYGREGSDGLGSGGDGGWSRDACEELLLRQEARIEELERIAGFGVEPAINSPTLTI